MARDLPLNFHPGIVVAVGEEKEQPLNLHVAAIGEQTLYERRAQRGEAFNDLVDLMEGLSCGLRRLRTANTIEAGQWYDEARQCHSLTRIETHAERRQPASC